MARPLRPQFPGAVYHITSRGNNKQDIYYDEKDRLRFLKFLGQTVLQYRWLCHGYCLMSNHYHLLLETPEPNLARGMKRLNSRYCIIFNKRHGRVGHVLQGRYNSVVVQKEEYLLELCRYIVLNPKRADMVDKPDDWKWSSYRATAGMTKPPDFLTTDWVLSHFGNRKRTAWEYYKRFVYDDLGKEEPWNEIKGGIYLGDSGFIKEVCSWMSEDDLSLEVPKVQRKASRPDLKELFPAHVMSSVKKRNERILEAFQKHLYTQREMGEYLGLHPAWVCQIIKRMKKDIP